MTTLVGEAADLRRQQHVETIVARLSRRYTDVGEAAVRNAVAAALDRYADARVQLFVPILAERRARADCDRLAAHGGGGPAAAGGV